MLLLVPRAHRTFWEQESDPIMQFGCIAQKLMHYSGPDHSITIIRKESNTL
jgi:hypothetical protein